MRTFTFYRFNRATFPEHSLKVSMIGARFFTTEKNKDKAARSLDIVADAIGCEIDAYDPSRQIIQSIETRRYDAPRERQRANLPLASERVSFVIKREVPIKRPALYTIRLVSNRSIDGIAIDNAELHLGSATRNSRRPRPYHIEDVNLDRSSQRPRILEALQPRGLRDPLPDRFESASNRFDVPQKREKATRCHCCRRAM